MEYKYLVWDKYIEQPCLMIKNFETKIATVDTVKDTSSFYAMNPSFELIEKTYQMWVSKDMQTLEERYTVIKQYN